MTIPQKRLFLQASMAMTMVGFSFCLGSIASFVALNVIAGENPTIEFSYWQRSFIDPIMRFVTMPGCWLLLFGNVGVFLALKGNRRSVNAVLLILSILILCNGLWIFSVAENVSNLAVEQFQMAEPLPAYSAKKTVEDAFGGMNMALLIVYLVTYVVTFSGHVDQAQRCDDATNHGSRC